MSAALNFPVDMDTRRACLGIIERAAERARLGLPVVLGTNRRAVKMALRGSARLHDERRKNLS